MTTGQQIAPNFPSTRHGHPALRLAVILGLCASLAAGFLISSSRMPAPGDTGSTPVACDASAAARHAC